MSLNILLEKVLNFESLNFADGLEFMRSIAADAFNNEQLAALLGILRTKGLTIDFIAGLREATLELANKPNFIDREFIDVCGTGGDGKNTFNISTGTALLLAAAGIKVVKHGNYAASSSCGSSNVLEALGYQFTNNSDILKRQLDVANICFLHAPLFHPVFKKVAPIRKALGFRTFFNLLGPLVNPALPKQQLLGVANFSTQRFLNLVLSRFDQNYAIVHSIDGYDEISLTGDFVVKGNRYEEYADPRRLGLPKLASSDLLTSDNAKVLLDICSGLGTLAQQSVLAANAAAALKIYKPMISWKDHFESALEIIKSGKLKITLSKILEK